MFRTSRRSASKMRSLSPPTEAAVKKKYGGIVPKKPPLISKDHEHAYFDSADWALGKQGVEKPKGPLEALQPKLQRYMTDIGKAWPVLIVCGGFLPLFLSVIWLVNYKLHFNSFTGVAYRNTYMASIEFDAKVLNVLKSKHEWLVREEARLETMKKDENAKYEGMRDFFLEEKHILLI